MTSVWKLFYYSPQNAEELKVIQAVLGFPELKIVKPSDTRLLSHELCVKAICKQLPPLLQTLSQLYESSGDAEAYGIYSLLAMVYQAVISYQISQSPCPLKLVHAEEDSRLQQASFYAQDYTWLSKFNQGEWCQLVYSSWDSHIELRNREWNKKSKVVGTNSTEITSFVSSTVSSTSCYSLPWYIDCKY